MCSYCGNYLKVSVCMVYIVGDNFMYLSVWINICFVFACIVCMHNLTIYIIESNIYTHTEVLQIPTALPLGIKIIGDKIGVSILTYVHVWMVNVLHIPMCRYS